MRFIFALLGLLLAGPAFAQNPVALNCYQGPTNPQFAPCPGAVTTLNSSTTTTLGNTFQTLTFTTAPSKSITIQNNNTNGDNCWLFIGSGVASKAISILLGPGGSYQRYFPLIPSDPLKFTCTTTADTIYVDSQ